MKEKEFPFLIGLKDWELKKLFIECRQILKERNLLQYDIIANTDYLYNKRNVYHKKTKRRKGKSNLIIEEKSLLPKVTFFTKKLCSFGYSILADWLHEDWSFLFPNANDESNKYYVYCHVIPNESINAFHNVQYRQEHFLLLPGKPFYIGKGCGNRAFDFSGRSTSHISKIKSLLNHGYDSKRISLIIEDRLTELEALELESKLIAFFGCMAEIPSNFTFWHGGQGGLLVNSDLGRRPEWVNDLNTQLFIFKTKRQKHRQ